MKGDGVYSNSGDEQDSPTSRKKSETHAEFRIIKASRKHTRVAIFMKPTRSNYACLMMSVQKLTQISAELLAVPDNYGHKELTDNTIKYTMPLRVIIIHVA